MSETAAWSDADIHRQLMEAVLDHRLTPGTRLGEDRLGQLFGVSRTRIRQVLIRLAQEQVVTLTPNRGASIAQPTPEDAREVFEVRRLIEPVLLQRFAQRADSADLQVLARNIREEESARRTGQRHAQIRLSGAFHQHIAERAGHETLGRILAGLISRTSLILMAYGQPPESSPAVAVRAVHPPCNCDDHRALLAAMKLRDVQAATRLLLDHLDRIESTLCFTPRLPDAQDPLDTLRPSAAPLSAGLA